MRAVDVAVEIGAEVEAVVALQPPVQWSEPDIGVPWADVRERALGRYRERVAVVLAGSQVPVRVLVADGPAGAMLGELDPSAVAGRVVGRLVGPAAPEDADPGSLWSAVAAGCPACFWARWPCTP